MTEKAEEKREKKGSCPSVPALKKMFPGVYRENDGVLSHTAKALGCSIRWLGRLLENDDELAQIRKEIDDEIDGVIQRRLYNIARGTETGHPTASIFWLKARQNWKDRQEVTHSGYVDFGEPPKEEQEPKRPTLAIVNGGGPPDPHPPEDDDGTV